jgi:hypothetical protein
MLIDSQLLVLVQVSKNGTKSGFDFQNQNENFKF